MLGYTDHIIARSSASHNYYTLFVDHFLMGHKCGFLCNLAFFVRGALVAINHPNASFLYQNALWAQIETSNNSVKTCALLENVVVLKQILFFLLQCE